MYNIWRGNARAQFRSEPTQIVATMYFESVWVMQSKNKAGCETTSLELGRQNAPVEGSWEEGGEGA